MIDYEYRAKDTKTGQIVHANVKADSPEAAAKLLAKQNLFTLDVKPAGQGGVIAQGLLSVFGNRVSFKERVLFTRQLATLINAGLPLSRALRTAQEQVQGKALNKALTSVVASVEGGQTLSQSFAQYPSIFNNVYVAMVAAGETSGSLDKALDRLALQQEKDAAIMSKIRGAMIYPLIVLVLIFALVIMMMVTVVPQVAKLFTDLRKPLPLATQILVGISNLTLKFWWLIPIILFAMVAGIRNIMKTEKAQYRLDQFKLKVPLFGPIFHKLYMARFTRTLSSLISSGVPLLQALETTRKAVGNRMVAADVSLAIEDVKSGGSLAKSLEQAPHFLKLVPQMAKIGEESGELDSMLERAAVYYEDEVDQAVKDLSTTLEPVMMVFLGIIVVGVLAATLGPVYSLVGSGDLAK